MTTWREEQAHWLQWAKQGGNDVQSIIRQIMEETDVEDIKRANKFYEAMAIHCGRGGSLDDQMPTELVRPERNER